MSETRLGATGKAKHAMCISDRTKQAISEFLQVSAEIERGTCRRVFINDWLWECSECGSRWDTGHLFDYCPRCGRRIVGDAG